MYKIDLYDKKLLYELDKNSSISITELSHRLRRSKQFILYRMKQLEKADIIKGYNAIVDMSKLGYFTFRLYFKFQQFSAEDGKQFVDYIKDRFHQVWTITSIHGKWDYAIFLGVKTVSEFHSVWDTIMLDYKPKIKHYNISIYAPIHNFNRKFFLEKSQDSVERIYGAGEKEEIDDLDWKIIETYSNNVRKSSPEISKKLKISADSVRGRIKKLEKKRIICGYKIGLNLEPLGFVSYRVDLQLISTKRNNALFEFCKNHSNIYQVNKTIGGSDFEIEVIVRDLSHLLKLLDEIKTQFKDVINDIDYFGFSVYHILHYIPD